MNKITYKLLFSLVKKEIGNKVSFDTSVPFSQQLKGTSSVSSLDRVYATLSNVTTSIQDLISELTPPVILDGLTVEPTTPISDKVTVSAGGGIAYGRKYTLDAEITLTVPFDGITDVFYINLYLDNITVDKSSNVQKLNIAKILVPQPDKSSRVVADRSDLDAYIMNRKELVLYWDGKNYFEEDSLEILRNNIGKILADNIVGNIKLNEDLKIINTAGTLELNSNAMKLSDEDENLLAEFGRDGVYFYDTNGKEMARFTNIDARIGNILITDTTIQSDDFVSGALGEGFRIKDTGEAEFLDVMIRGKITSSVFERDSISAVGGNLLVMDGDVLSENMSALDNSTLTISGGTTFVVGDFLRIKDNSDDEWFEVTGISSNTYTVIRDKKGDYTTNNNPEWKKGTTIVNYKKSGDGGIYLTSSESDAPYLDILTHAGEPWNTITTKVRLGKLDGITDADYGALSGYGLFADNVFLKGSLYSPIIKTDTTGERIELTSMGLIMYDDSDDEVFSVLLDSISGLGDVGDIIIGDYENDKGIKWDNSEGSFNVKGIITATSGYFSGLITVGASGNLVLDGVDEAVKVFGDTIVIETDLNDVLDWNEDGTPYSATIDPDTYTPTELAAEVQAGMRAEGDSNTTVTYNSTTRKITIANSTLTTLSLLFYTGDDSEQTIGQALGFTINEDKDSALSYIAEVETTLRVTIGLL